MNNVINRNAELRGISDEMLAKRQAEFVISSEAVDSYGTVFKMDGWKLERYNRNPVVSYNHSIMSGNPDNINGTIRYANNCDYFDIKDLEIDFSLFDEWGIVNCRPYNLGGGSLGYIRINFIPMTDLSQEDYEIKCLEHKVDENDFLSSIMGGKI